MAEQKKEIVFKNDLAELEKLCQRIREFGKSLNIPEKSIFQVCLAIEEICANIISHGFNDNFVHWIKVTIGHKRGNMELRVEDDGIPFNPIEAEAPDLSCPIERRKEGGLGCYLINNLMDSVDYKRLDKKNILIVNKKIC